VFTGSEEKMLVCTDKAPERELLIKLHFLAIAHDQDAVSLEDSVGIQIGWNPENCWIVPVDGEGT
jgi:hypothetical protein